MPVRGVTHFAPQSLTAAPFGPSSYDKDPAAKRLNLELRATPEMEEYFSALDEWSIEHLAERSEEIWGKPLAADRVRELYTPILRRREGHEPLVRTKIDLEGRSAVTYWNASAPPRMLDGPPGDWRDAELKVRFLPSHIWFMGSTGVGWVIRTLDVQVFQPVKACPFG